MEFYNPDNGTYFLSLHVLKDMDSTVIPYILDQKPMEFPISNQGEPLASELARVSQDEGFKRGFSIALRIIIAGLNEEKL